jgi:ferredoxin
MIVAKKKLIKEITESLSGCKRVLIVACGSCVTVCLSGGAKQADELASQLRLAARAAGGELTVDTDCMERQCDREFVSQLTHDLKNYDAVLSIACGVGVGFMSELFPASRVLPGLNTTFYGAATADGVWEEYCHGCGDCVLAMTGGVCPIARCSKSLVNGPCGGTTKTGKCEVSADMDCGWHLIYERAKAAGRLEAMRVLPVQKPRNWAKDRSGGARRLIHKELTSPEDR